MEQIGSANHDYLQSEFYLTGIKGDTLKWGNSYQDDAGAKSEVMTYALPIRNNLDAFRSGERRPLGNVLITGATGYLGIHILHELIHSDAQNIYCLVRAKSQEKGEGQAGMFAFAVCMNLLQVYNLFVSGTCQTLQSLGAIQVGRRDAEGLRLVLRKSFRFITVSMIITCLFVWIDPEAIAALFGADHPDYVAEANHALRVFALSFVPFCYIYVLMIVYKLHGHHHMALFISFALSLTVIPVLWAVSQWAPNLLWYSYLIAYFVEGIAIFILHRHSRISFTLSQN